MTRWLVHGSTGFLAVSTAVLMAIGACSGGDEPRRGTGVTPTGGHQGGSDGTGGAATGACDGDEIQSCKVQIDETNCFVGEQQCQNGEWGPCVDPEKLDTANIGPISDCPNNPCNPWCQQFGGEMPASPITAAGSAAPAGGPISGLPSNWQSAGQNEPCSGPADCQFDTYCDTNAASPTYQKCVPWAYDGFDAANTTAPDITAPVQCTSSSVTICNRANVAVPPGTDVEVGTFDASTGDFGSCMPTSTVKGTCVWSAGIAPGECVNVTGCSISGTTNIYANVPDPPGTSAPTAITESSCNNNWSVYHPSTGCSCTNVNSSGSLQQVNIYMLLDNSGSMGGPAQGCTAGYCTDSWDSATGALATFVASSAADPLRMLFSVYDTPNGGCDDSSHGGSCSVTACEASLYGPEFLSNATHQSDIVNWLNNAANAPPYPATTATPHSPALEAAANIVDDWNTTTFPGEKNVIVYISDGGSDNCGATQAQVAAKVSGVDAYTIALPGSSISLLNAVAFAGGTGAAKDLRAFAPGAALNTALANALTAIQQAVASCTVTIPNVGQVDTSMLTVTWTPTVGSPIVLQKVANAGACNMTPPAGVMQYYLVPSGSPTDLQLCAPACTAVQTDVTSTIDILGECIGGYAQDTYGPEAYAADCAAIGSGQPVWEFLYYDTTQVGDSTIEFQMRTGNDATEAGMGPFTTVATANLANPDALGGSPIDLSTTLGPLVQQSNIELQMVITPTTGGAATPELISWSLQYSCLDSE